MNFLQADLGANEIAKIMVWVGVNTPSPAANL